MAGGLDFVVELVREGEGFRVGVRSPAGEYTGPVLLDADALVAGLEAVQARVLASSSRVRAARPLMSAIEAPLRKLGAGLFTAVLGGHSGALLAASREVVEREGEPFRIVLRLPAELAVLPWELLFDDLRGEYVCRRSALVRYVEAPETVRQVRVDGPLRVLGMTALPGNLAQLDADAEREQLTDALEPLRQQGLVDLEWVDGQRLEDLMDALLAGGPYHLFHFIGHGGFDAARGEGGIAFADDRGKAHLVPASHVGDVLTAAGVMPHLVVLNSCATATAVATDVFSSAGASLVRRIPAVVAMQYSITDDAAKAFSRAFYRALASNRGIDEAVRIARIAISSWHPDTLEWITPVLYMRSHDTHLLTLQRQAPHPTPAQAPPVPTGDPTPPTSDQLAAPRETEQLTARELTDRGITRYNAGRQEQALADLNRAIDLDPDNVVALAARGSLHGLAGRTEKALIDLNRGLELEPNNSWALSVRRELLGGDGSASSGSG
ncbi:CHAT domain-containing protein [Streptomyces mayteni]